MAGADDASAHGSVPATPPVGLGFGFDPNVAHSQPATANSSPSRSLRPPISPTRQRSSSSNYFSDRVSPAPSTSNVPFATPPATANPGGSRPGTPSLSPLSLKRLSRGLSSRSTHNTASGPPSPAGSGRRVAPSEASAVDNFVFEQGGLGTATLKAPIRSKSHSVLPGEAGNDLVPVQPPSRSVSMKVDSRAGGGGRPGWSQPPRPLPLNLQQTSERSRSESNQSGVSSGESSIATPPTGPSRAESTLSSPARSRSNSTAQPLLPLSSSSANAQPSPPPSPSITSSSIAGLLKGGKKERERKASITAAGEADPRSRSGSNESQTSGSRVARALGLGRRQA